MKQVFRTYSNYYSGSLMSVNEKNISYICFYELLEKYFNSIV